jgi:hypothetical protein
VLDSEANAVTIEHMRHVYLSYPAEETTHTTRYEYRITGDSISVGSFKPCPFGAMCVGNRIGKLSESGLTLTFGSPTDPVYQYHLAQTF